MEYLVGYTGFVGSNLAASHTFDGQFNSRNIQQAFGGRPDLLVYAGVRAEMFLANHDPEADLANLRQAADNIARIAPRQLVLISSISVYDEPKGADEDTPIHPERLTAYGANRRWLEQWVEEQVPGHLIVRLPALYGRNLKKNFLYDYLHFLPPMLTQAKREELGGQEPLILDCYQPLGNGFYKCRELEGPDREALKAAFRRVGFSALNFTDSRSRYQFYHLAKLWGHICRGLELGLDKLNLATQPVSAGEVYHALCGGEFVNHLDKPPFDYDFRTKHAAAFGGQQGYLEDREQVLAGIRAFVAREEGQE